MTERIAAAAVEEFDLITHSPDAESRGILFRTGDFFPLNPTAHTLSAPATPATQARPWGLRYLVVPRLSAGKHEGKSRPTSAGSPDGTAPEEVGTD
ncbi:hypothetical protein [Salinactinospora qingdaonensis]|uniref:ATP-grasp target RiPP n=1 Tax=Salinactinospora qingdaonensis TaxID=702744 RepID=A0ABP7FFN7_9ACTN